MLDWFFELLSWLPWEYLPGRILGPLFVVTGILIAIYWRMPWVGGALVSIGAVVSAVAYLRSPED